MTLTYFTARSNFPGFVCFVLYLDKISGERLQDHWSSGFIFLKKNVDFLLEENSSRVKIIKILYACFILSLVDNKETD